MKIYSVILFCLIGFLPVCFAQICGCNDPLASNFNPNATVNDGSCIYNSSSISNTSVYNLPSELNETSGLIFWNNHLWTNNDDSDNHLYALDTFDMHIDTLFSLLDCTNIEWEEISQDEQYIYLGDFGNNNNGNRTDLKILRVDKNSILDNNPVVDTIWYRYSLQTDFSPIGSDHTNFDCEAMIVSADSIYLFTKEWTSNYTTLYSMPKIPGTYIAQDIASYNVQGLVTGATYSESQKVVVLVGYSSTLQPFFLLLYDFPEHQFFSGNKRKVGINLSFHQMEGVASLNGLIYYTSNEKFSQLTLNIPARINKFDLSSFLLNYLDPNSIINHEVSHFDQIQIFPNPSSQYFQITGLENQNDCFIEIINLSGESVLTICGIPENYKIDISDLPSGVYFIRINQKLVKNGLSIKTIEVKRLHFPFNSVYAKIRLNSYSN